MGGMNLGQSSKDLQTPLADVSDTLTLRVLSPGGFPSAGFCA